MEDKTFSQFHHPTDPDFPFRDLAITDQDVQDLLTREGIKFGSFDSAKSGLWLLEREAPTPKEKAITDSVPYQQGEYDFSMLDNQRYFEVRTLTYKFIVFDGDPILKNDLAAPTAVMSLGHKAVSAAKSFFKIGSPSRVMMQYGQWFTEGFAIGVTDEIRMVKQAVTAMSKAAMVNPSLSPAGFQDSLSRLNGSVSGNYNGTLTMQDSTLQMQNNQLLRQLVNKSGDVYMDGTPVGHIVAPTVSQDLGQGVSLKGRWS